MNPIHGLTLTCAGRSMIRWSGLITLRLMGWFPPETAMEAEGTGRVWFVPSTFWKITMARKPENFQNCFFFRYFWQNQTKSRVSFDAWDFSWFIFEDDYKKNLQNGKLWRCSSIGAERLPICLHVFCCLRSSLGRCLICFFVSKTTFDFQKWQQKIRKNMWKITCSKEPGQLQSWFWMSGWMYQEVKQ